MKNIFSIILSASIGASIVLFTLSFTNGKTTDQASKVTEPTVHPKVVVEYEYRLFTTVESLVPGGMGRSRMVVTDSKGQETESELTNFFSMVGINFGNIAKNDKTIVNKINEWSSEGWELQQVVAGVQGNGNNALGLYLTRYFFRREKK